MALADEGRLFVVLVVAAAVVTGTLAMVIVSSPPNPSGSSTSGRSGSPNPPQAYNCTPPTGSPGVTLLAAHCLGNWPQTVLFDTANQFVYVATEYSENVSVLSASGLHPIATISTSNYARGLALDPNNGRMFVSDGFGSDVAVIDTSSNTLVDSFNTGYGYLVGAQFDTTTGQLFFLANNNDDILSVNPTNYAMVQTIPVQANTGGGVDPIGGVDPQSHVMYYAARGNMEVDLVGELNGTVFGYFPTGGGYGPTNTFYDPYNHLLYVAAGGWLYLGYGNQVIVINATTGSSVTNLTVGGFPSSFAYDSTRHLLYVSCAATGVVSVINDTTNQVVATISLGAGTLPGDIAVDPATGNVFVGEDGTGMLVELPPT